MSHKAVEAQRLSAGTPAELTLDALQQRLNQAETGAKKLTKHLNKYGYKYDESDSSKAKQPGKKTDSSSRNEKMGRKKAKESEDLQKSFSEMATRVCKMEGTLHSLKLGMHGLESEKSTKKDTHSEDMIELKERHKIEVRKFEEMIKCLKEESEETKKRDEEVQDEIEQMIRKMKQTEEFVVAKDSRIAELEAAFNKVSAQRSDLEVQLQREVTLRQSVEDAHEALLMRIRDMEVVVDSERGQVSDLLNNWDNAKNEAAATREAFENEHELRMQLEALVAQQEDDFAAMKDKLAKLSESKKMFENENSKLRRENKTLKQQKEIHLKSHEELKASYDAAMKDCQKLHEALKIAATDNKALISQHKDVLHREKEKVTSQLAIQDKMLDNAKEAILKELDREKAAVRTTEAENLNLKSSVKSLEGKVDEKDQKIAILERKYENDLRQLNSLVEASRKDRDLTLEEKNNRILDLQRKFDELNQEKIDLEMTMREMKIEIEKSHKLLKNIKNEKEQLVSRLNSAEQNQLSQKQIETAFSDIMAAKNKLAYENGMLQSKVDQLNTDVKELREMNCEHENLRQKHLAMNNQYNAVLNEMQNLKIAFSEKEVECKQFRATVQKKGLDFKALERAKGETLRETQKLLMDNKDLQEQQERKINAMENALQLSHTDNRKLAESFDGVMLSHSKLQASLEELQIKLGRKDSEIQNLLSERASTQKIVTDLQKEMDNLQTKILSLEENDSDELTTAKKAAKTAESKVKRLTQSNENLEKENISLKEKIENLKIDMGKKMEQMEEDAEEREMLEKGMHAKSKEEKEEIESDYRRQIEKLKSNYKQAEKKLSLSAVENTEKKKKIKKLKEEYFALKKEKDSLKIENKKQVSTLKDLVSRIQELEGELRYTANLHTQANISTRQFEDEVEREKFIRIEAESRCMSLESKEKDLERKLLQATREKLKVSDELQQAQIWFQKKVGELETELETATQTQYILEQTNIEQEKLLENKSEEARKIVRASRLAVNQLSSEVADNLWETKGLKRLVQAERSYASRAAQKYDILMESSARKVEELARELDRAHEKARKAR